VVLLVRVGKKEKKVILGLLQDRGAMDQDWRVQALGGQCRT
jgi:hypothetical protein